MADIPRSLSQEDWLYVYVLFFELILLLGNQASCVGKAVMNRWFLCESIDAPLKYIKGLTLDLTETNKEVESVKE